jgi:hypothetical protein
VAVVVGLAGLAVAKWAAPGLLSWAQVAGLMAGWAVLGAGAVAGLAVRAARRARQAPPPGLAGVAPSETQPVAPADQAQGFGWMKASDLLQHRATPPDDPAETDQLRAPS